MFYDGCPLSETVRNETWCYSVLTCFLFWIFFFKFNVCMTGKSTVLGIYIHKRVKLIVFDVSMKTCDESSLAVLK